MGRSSVWVFLLSLSLSHQSVTAQAEGNVTILQPKGDAQKPNSRVRYKCFSSVLFSNARKATKSYRSAAPLARPVAAFGVNTKGSYWQRRAQAYK